MASTFGWTHKEILNLTTRQFFMYLSQCGRLDAKQHIMSLETTLYPYQNIEVVKQRIEDLRKIYHGRFIKKKLDQKTIDAAWKSLREGVGR